MDEKLLETVSDPIKLKSVLDAAFVAASAEEGVLEDSLNHTQVVKLQNHLTTRQFLALLEEHRGEGVTLRALFCWCCPSVREAEIEDGMRWCKAYRAHDVLEELLKYQSSPMVDPRFHHNSKPEDMNLEVDEDDIDALFEALDMDGDGDLSMAELCRGGKLELEEGRRLIELWDRDKTGNLSKADVTAIVFQMHSSVRQTMKAVFADSRFSFSGTTSS